MILMVPQSGTEHVLAARAAQLGVEVVRGAEVTRIEQDNDGVTIGLANYDSLRARYVVGCDGAHSAVRRLVGVDFVGTQYATAYPAGRPAAHPAAAGADVRQDQQPGRRARPPVRRRVVSGIAWDRLREQAPLSEPVTMAEMRDAYHRIAGDDFGMSEMRWSSRFLSERRQARHYRVGPGFPRRRRCACAFADRRPGHEHRYRRCDEPGLETRFEAVRWTLPGGTVRLAAG